MHGSSGSTRAPGTPLRSGEHEGQPGGPGQGTGAAAPSMAPAPTAATAPQPAGVPDSFAREVAAAERRAKHLRAVQILMESGMPEQAEQMRQQGDGCPQPAAL